MRKLAVLFAAVLPVVTPIAAFAEQVVLRVEARRASEAQAAADKWSAQFPNVVTFPLQNDWVAIGIGPMERAEADAEIARLKAGGDIPNDSFIAPAPENATAVTELLPPPSFGAAEPEPTGNPAAAASTFPSSGLEATTPPSNEAEGQPTAAVEAPAAAETTPPPDYIRLQRLETLELAQAALAKWRADFPETGLWLQSDGAYAVTLGPVDPEIGEAWLTAFRRAERVGRPATIMSEDELGHEIDDGADPKLPPPGTAEMPALIDIQRALRWAGHYDGKIDGKDGPQTQAAINAEVVTLRAAPDAASAMQALIERREEWRATMGLTALHDPQSGLTVTAPMDKLEFDRDELGLSIYGPKNGSGAALIMYSAPGGQQEMLDFTGLVTALGWVPSPERSITQGHASLKGRNDTHIGQAEARVEDGMVEGIVVIWPVLDEQDQPRIAAELIDSMTRTPVEPTEPDTDSAEPASAEPAVN